MRTRHGTKAVGGDVEGDHRRLAAVLDPVRVGSTCLAIAWSSEAMPSGRSLPKPQTWRIENTSAAAFMARSA